MQLITKSTRIVPLYKKKRIVVLSKHGIYDGLQSGFQYYNQTTPNW
jgi:hypothetical protein